MNKKTVLDDLAARKQESIDFLRSLIKIDSSNIQHGLDGKEEAAQLFIQQELQRMGMNTKLSEPNYARIGNYVECSQGHSYANRPNLLGVLKGSGGGRSLILNGHVDTMSAENRDKWIHDPWSATIENGYVYGIGACDMKAGLAAMVCACKAVAKHVRLQGDVILQSVVDEEGGGNGTLDLVAQGQTADGAIISEPTELKVMIASRGVLVIHVQVTGEASHPNYKWEKANAVEKAIKIWNVLNELEHRWLATKNHPLLPRPTITIGKIQGGVAGTAVPALCDMYFDVEFLPEVYDLDGSSVRTTGLDFEKEFTDAVMRCAASDEWLSKHPPKIRIYQHVEPHSVERNFELVDLLVGNHGDGKVSAFPAGCDARHLAQAGIKTVIYGPGSMADAHNVNEKVKIDQYLHCIETLALTIMDWCGIE